MNQSRLYGFLSVWLAKCVVPTREAVAVGVILPVVRLAHGFCTTLVPDVIANIHHGLQEVVISFLKGTTKPPRTKLA